MQVTKEQGTAGVGLRSLPLPSSPCQAKLNEESWDNVYDTRLVHLLGRDLSSGNRSLILSWKGLVGTTLGLQFRFQDLHQLFDSLGSYFACLALTSNATNKPRSGVEKINLIESIELKDQSAAPMRTTKGRRTLAPTWWRQLPPPSIDVREVAVGLFLRQGCVESRASVRTIAR